jgi:hypothetical protein
MSKARHVLPVLLALYGLASSPSDVSARIVCRDEDCGREEDLRILPPFPPDSPGPPAPRAPLRLAEVRPRLVALGPRVDECFATHFDGEHAPRAYPMTVFVHPDGRWSLAFGPRPRVPSHGAELRGETPLEVCISDWISGEIGPRIQPPGGRAPRRVAVSYRPHLAPGPVALSVTP